MNLMIYNQSLEIRNKIIWHIYIFYIVFTLSFFFYIPFFFAEILITVECQSFLLISQLMLLTAFGWIVEKRRYPLRWSGVCCHKVTEDLDSAGLGKNLRANN